MEDNINDDITKNDSLNSGESIKAISYSPDGKFIAGVQGNKIIIWERSSGKRFRSFISQNKLACIAYNPNGSEIVVGDVNCHSTVYSKGGKMLRNLN